MLVKVSKNKFVDLNRNRTYFVIKLKVQNKTLKNCQIKHGINKK